MNETKKTETCCGEPNAIDQAPAASETACCPPPHAAIDAEDSSVCCGSRVDPPSMQGARTERRLLEIEFLYLDLSVCERCQDTGSTLEEALAEVSPILESTGVEVALNKIHVTSEEQAVALGFRVSPTIRLNGRDIQMNFRESLCESCDTLCECEGGVSCREWEYRGQWHTAPPKGMIIEAILKELYGGAGEGREKNRKLEEAPENLKRFYSGLRKQATAENL